MRTSINIILKALWSSSKIRLLYGQVFILERSLLELVGEKLERGKAVARQTRRR